MVIGNCDVIMFSKIPNSNEKLINSDKLEKKYKMYRAEDKTLVQTIISCFKKVFHY